MGKIQLVQSLVLNKWYLARVNKDGTMSADKREVPEKNLMDVVVDWCEKMIEENSAVHAPITCNDQPYLDVIIFKSGKMDKLHELIQKMEEAA